MSGDKELNALIDTIYEAVLNSDLWPSVLVKLADALGAAQIAMPSFDCRANIFTTIAPRIDPDLTASYREYWAFRDPVFGRAILRPAREIYTLDSLMPREEFAATPVFNEWWRPARWGFATAGASLVAADQFSALVCISNAPGKDLTEEQLRLFKAVARHLRRAVRINRQLWKLELKHLAFSPTEPFDTLSQCALLVDASARVVVTNAAAKPMLDARDGIFLRDGRLAVAGSLDALQKLIASCAQNSLGIGGPGGELKVPREPPRPPLHVTVTPLRSAMRLAEVPWIGVGTPVAIVMVTNPDSDRRQEINLRRRFGLTAEESGLAVEILKGDGREAAARRRGISVATAKTHLAHIFEKTGTHRHAKLIRLLLDAANAREMET
ncbi:MAG: helix-turn-helix transcriptional regulator [Pseudomonadota bacterium]|nr:helix-turn-helix transcriptional regulator [Pseudomonadota bacterium]